MSKVFSNTQCLIYTNTCGSLECANPRCYTKPMYFTIWGEQVRKGLQTHLFQQYVHFTLFLKNKNTALSLSFLNGLDFIPKTLENLYTETHPRDIYINSCNSSWIALVGKLCKAESRAVHAGHPPLSSSHLQQLSGHSGSKGKTKY